MSSTNKTTNYELSQFLGTDKPAWLSDYNTDMSKIDAQMKLNADGVTSAGSSATSANTKIGDLSSLTTTDKTSVVSAVNEVNTTAGTAYNTATGASDTAGQALGKATANETAIIALNNKFNLSNSSNLTFTGATFSSNSMKAVYDNSLTLGKIYGRITITNPTAGLGWKTFTSTETPFADLNLEEAITIDVCGFTQDESGVIRSISLTINTNGSVSIRCYFTSASYGYAVQYMPCLYILQDFGDTPEE